MRQIILDTETTGLSAATGDRVIEIGCVELVNRRLTGNNKHLYLNPERDSHPDALKVHGISNEFLLDKPKFHEVVEDFLAYCQDAEIIIHNAPFDVGFLDKELELAGKLNFKSYVNNVVDTLFMAKELYPGRRNSLDALCDRLGVDNSGRTLHGALLDAELLADVYINLTRGQHSLLGEATSTNTAQAATSAVRVDLSQFVSPIIYANEQEQAEHETVLTQIDKASGGKTVWRQTAA